MSNDRCDICQFKDGRKGFTLLTCKACKVHIHRECYGLTTHMADLFQNCFACNAVGKTFEGITSKGVIKKILVEKRPEECALCSISDGKHAMHPLYNDYGEKGRQLILPNGKLGWVHSLCGLVLSKSRGTAGSVYGCDVEGGYEGDQSDEERQAAAVVDGDTAATDVSLHRFVICGKEYAVQWHNLCEHRELTCIGCGKKDPLGYRVPVQCTAGDPDEFQDFAEKHSYIDGACYQAMHIGCAMWGANRGIHRRIFFFPGYGSIDAVVELYCPKHAADINAKQHVKQGGLTRQQNHTMIGYEKPGDASQAKRAKASSSHIPAKKRDLSTLSVPAKQPAPKRVARTNMAIEKRLKAKSQAALAKAAEKRGGTPSPLSKKSTIILPVARRSSSNTSSLLSGSIPKKVLPQAVIKGLQNSSSTLQAPDLTIPKKRGAKPMRSVGSYATATEATLNTQNNKRRPHLFPKSSTRELPPPPAYQRTSANVGKTKRTPKEAKMCKTSIDLSVDDDETPDVAFEDEEADVLENSEPAPAAKKKAPSLRRRYLSEGKSNEECFDDDFDWVGTMIADMENVIAISVHDGNDLNEVVEARRCFWKQRSGIFSSDFVGVWEKVMGHFSSGMIGSKDETEESALESSGLIEFNVDPDKGPGKGKGKWAKLWNDQALLFEFGDWDTSVEKLKRSKEL